MSFEAKGYKQFVKITRLALVHAATVVDLYKEDRISDAAQFLKAYKECMSVDGGLGYNTKDHLPVVIAKGFSVATEKFEAAIKSPNNKVGLEEASKYIIPTLQQLENLDGAIRAD